MRYDDIKIFKSIYTDNQQIHAANEQIVDRLEDLARNENLKYLNFKVIGIAVAVGLVIGLLSGVLIAKYSKTYDFQEKLTEKEFKKQKFDIYPDNEFACRINGKRFIANDVINGWMFRKTVPSWKKLIFTDPAETKSFTVDLKKSFK